MKKVNLLSKAEMKKVMGGNAPGTGCLQDCTTHDAVCTRDGKTGVCTFIAADSECPGGQYSCNLPGGILN